MAVKPATVALFKSAIVEVDKIGKSRKAIDAKMKEITAKLEAAIDKKQKPMIDLYLKSLEAEVNLITRAMTPVDVTIGNLNEVQDDEDFVATRLADLEKLTNIVNEARDDYTQLFEEAKNLENKAEKASDAIDDSRGQALRALARLDRGVDDAKKDLGALFRKADEVASRASAAVDAHDAKALSEAQKAFDALGIEVVLNLHADLIERVKAFGKQALSKTYGPDLQAELLDGVKDMLAKEAGTKVYVEQLGVTSKLVAGMVIEAVDIAKAAKALAIERKGEAQLAKVLNGPLSGMEKGLDALAKQLGMKAKGKDMLVALKKAGIV